MRISRILRSSLVPAALLVVLTLLFTAGPVSATYPGQNGLIVFVANRNSDGWQLYTMNPDGSNIQQLTKMPPTDWDLWTPSYSPNGKQIAFCRDSPQTPNAPDLFVINADGTGLQQLTFDALFDCAPNWSKDGKHLIFAQGLKNGRGVITLMRADGTGQKVQITKDLWTKFAPVYTPDNTRIVFYNTKGGLIGAVWIMNADGTGQQRLTTAAFEGIPSDVSPDGQHIALSNHINTSRPSNSYVMDLNGTNLTQLTHSGTAHTIPGSYSPDGTRVVFTSDHSGTPEIYTMNPDGSGVQQITNGATAPCPDENCPDPSWGPKPQ